VEKNPELLQALESAYSQVSSILGILCLTCLQEHLPPDTSLMYWIGLHHLSQWAFSPVRQPLSLYIYFISLPSGTRATRG
jgi:hypothetical protein